MNSDPITITVFDFLSALGIGRHEATATLAEGESACMPAYIAVPPEGADPTAGEVPPFNLREILPSPKTYLDRHSELFLAATALALQDSRLSPGMIAPERVGLAVGTAWGGIGTLDTFFADYIHKGPRLVKPLLFPHSYANAAISLAAMEWEIRGPHLNFVSHATASTQALIAAFDTIRAGEADLVVAGGTEALSPARWKALLAEGRGLPPGEGAAAFLIERRSAAAARGAAPVADLLGGSLVQNAAADTSDLCRQALQKALTDASLKPNQIRSLYLPQSLERQIDSPWRIQAPDALYGHTCGASGALLTACALLAPHTLPAVILTATQTSAAALVVGPCL